MQRTKQEASFDHLAREYVELRRDGDAEHIGGFAVDRQIEAGGLLDRKLARLCALKYLVHIGCGAAKEIRQVPPIPHESAALRVFTLWEHGRQTVCERELGNTPALSEEDSVSRHHD